VRLAPLLELARALGTIFDCLFFIGLNGTAKQIILLLHSEARQKAHEARPFAKK
jgi:hypothetical protein